MSYSRWANSEFYTYWVGQEELISKEDELFCCHYDLNNVKHFSYQEVVDYMADPDSLWELEEIKSFEHLNEMLRYFRNFVRDVNKKWK